MSFTTTYYSHQQLVLGLTFLRGQSKQRWCSSLFPCRKTGMQKSNFCLKDTLCACMYYVNSNFMPWNVWKAWIWVNVLFDTGVVTYVKGIVQCSSMQWRKKVWGEIGGVVPWELCPWQPRWYAWETPIWCVECVTFASWRSAPSDAVMGASEHHNSLPQCVSTA